jgi:hypothetical protein
MGRVKCLILHFTLLNICYVCSIIHVICPNSKTLSNSEHPTACHPAIPLLGLASLRCYPGLTTRIFPHQNSWFKPLVSLPQFHNITTLNFRFKTILVHCAPSLVETNTTFLLVVQLRPTPFLFFSFSETHKLGFFGLHLNFKTLLRLLGLTQCNKTSFFALFKHNF